MDTIRNLGIILGIVTLISVGAHFVMKSAPLPAETLEKEPISLSQDPRIVELRNAIDLAGKNCQWDFSKKENIKKTIGTLQNLAEKIQIAHELKNIEKVKDRDNLLSYHEVMLSKVFDKGIVQFFKSVTIAERFNLRPIYDAYEKLDGKYREVDSPFNIAAHYYGVSGIQTLRLANTEAINLSTANKYMEKIENANTKEMLKHSALYKTVRKKCKKLIADKTLVFYEDQIEAYFNSNFFGPASTEMKSDLYELKASKIGSHSQTKILAKKFRTKNETFERCDRWSTTPSQYTQDLFCRKCAVFPFYKNHVVYQECED